MYITVSEATALKILFKKDGTPRVGNSAADFFRDSLPPDQYRELLRRALEVRQ